MSQYYYAVDGKRHGPISFGSLRELATKAELKRTHQVWCPGMKEWQSAVSIEKLFDDLPPDLDSESPLTPPPLPSEATDTPGSQSPTAANPAQQAAPQDIWTQPAKTETDLAADQFMKQERQVFMVGYPIGNAFVAIGIYFQEKASGVEGSPDQIGAVLCLLLGLVGLALAVFNWMKLHHQLWKLIPPALAPTTPAKAVGFYFIPFFSVYWSFVTFNGLVTAANKTLAALKERKVKCNEGLAIAFSVAQALLLSGVPGFIPILAVLVSIASYVLWIPWYGDLAKAFVVIERHARLLPARSPTSGNCASA